MMCIRRLSAHLQAGHTASDAAHRRLAGQCGLEASLTLKVLLALAQEVQVKADREALQKVVALRNAFAHHATYAYPVLSEGATPEETTQYNMLLVLQSSGKTARLKRHEAYEEFLLSYGAAKKSILEIKREVLARLER